MDPLTIGIVALGATLTLIAVRVPIAYSIGLPSVIGLFAYFATIGGGFDTARGWTPTVSLLASTPFEFIHNYSLSMIPIFIAVGNIAYRSGITGGVYDGFRIALARLPGGLAIASVLGCGGFSAITGSSVACAAAMGRVAVPEMLQRGYHPSLSCGSVAAGGTLGSLIPPSVAFIIYATFAEASVGKLFLAGVLPGLLSLAGYVITILVWVRLRPGIAPVTPIALDQDPKAGRGRLVQAFSLTWRAALIVFIVVFGIYFGIFTPTESAAVSLAVVVTLGFFEKKLSLSDFYESVKDAARQTAALFFIAIAAKLFVTLMSLTQLAPQLVGAIEASNLHPALILTAIVLVYLVLGMFLDPIGTMLLTLPFVIPYVEGQGYDLIWFGVVVVKLLEIGLITPPVGLNAFILNSVLGDKAKLEVVFSGVARFLFLDVVVLILIVAFPWISLVLPRIAW